MTTICDGLRVLELGAGSVPASLAGMVLADHGARVIKVEPPEGDRLREAHPSGAAVWNRGKESVVADLRTSNGQASVRELRARRRRRHRGVRTRSRRRVGHRIRCASGGQPGPRLLRDLGLRTERRVRAPEGLRGSRVREGRALLARRVRTPPRARDVPAELRRLRRGHADRRRRARSTAGA